MRQFLAGVLLLALVMLGQGCVTRLPNTVSAQKNIEYSRVAGHSLRLDLYTPKEFTGRLPVLLWIHGGSWRHGNKDFCPIAFLAASNVAVVSINYRLSDEAVFPAQLEDCKTAVRWLRANAGTYRFDPEHIGILGASAGGHLAALLGTTGNTKEFEGAGRENLDQSSRVQAVCAFYPPTDLDAMVVKPESRQNPRSDIGRFLGGALEANRERAKKANPINYVSKETAPFFLVHGDKDRWVPISQSELLHAALNQAGVESIFRPLAGKGHGAAPSKEVAAEIVLFFERHLRRGAAAGQ